LQGITLLFVIGSVVVAGLALYAGLLLAKLYQQQQRHKLFLARAAEQQVEAIKARNDNILESVFIIAMACKQDQCDISEAAIRLYKLMEVLQADKQVDFAATYPALTDLYQVVKDMPRGDARQQIEKQSRMRFDLERMKAESRLQADIKLELDAYNYSGPRYTSYPTALEFNQAFTSAEFEMACQQYPDRKLSLYIHIPFCHKLCYYCGCNKIITRHQHKADQYLEVLEQEIKQRATLLGDRQVSQLHWGGGTPTFLTAAQISRLMTALRSAFNFDDDAEISIEVDPREIELSILDHLRSEGFNRLSIGVQDFNKDVQKLVNREQDEDFIFAMVNRARELGFRSTNLDLIYGLPLQTKALFAETLQQVLTMKPGRLSVLWVYQRFQ
jgi:tRNA A37 methylthiotransferase MiaB